MLLGLALASHVLLDVLGSVLEASVLSAVPMILVDPSAWLLVTGLVQVARRRPTAAPAAAAVLAIVSIALAMAWGQVGTVALTLPFLLFALVAASLSLPANRIGDGRPIAATLAAGAALAIVVRGIGALLAAAFTMSPQTWDLYDSRLTMVPSGYWFALDAIEVGPHVMVGLAVSAVLLVAGALAVLGWARPRRRSAHLMLAAGSTAAAVLLCAQAWLAPAWGLIGPSTARAIVLAIPEVVVLAMVAGVWSRGTRAWFRARRQAPPGA